MTIWYPTTLISYERLGTTAITINSMVIITIHLNYIFIFEVYLYEPLFI